MYNYNSVGSSTEAGIWTIISAVVAVIGGIVLYFTFLKKSNEGKFKGFAGWMYEFLSFKEMLIESLLKVFYLICALFITLSSFALIGNSFLGFVAVLIGGNILVRIVYEFSLVLLVICRNTTDINNKLVKKACETKTCEPKTEVVEEKTEA